MAAAGFSNADPRPIAQAAPYTFYLPHGARIAAVGLGDEVKLIFEYHGPVEEWAVERM
ncbi:hypothetical protein [uncultured Sphingomonas sp.]|uniref:hypothetical protein n=1 Tax=uncultured Sphingomonas sp. TaxID=158754 RepID=UPI0025ED2EDB|nr:hypothetical protein [uncultured Sphingomonas sp.]